MPTLVGDVAVKIGADEPTSKTINPKSFTYWEEHTVTPQTVMNVKAPIAFHQSHKHVKGEMAIKDMDEVIAAMNEQAVNYMPAEANHPTIPYFVAEITDSDGEKWTATFTGGIFVDFRAPHVDEDYATRVYRFVATKVVEARPA